MNSPGFSPSRNRGPGDISAALTPGTNKSEAGRFRNRLSNTQTAKKKIKAAHEALKPFSASAITMGELMGGSGVTSASYCAQRPKIAPKKVEVPDMVWYTQENLIRETINDPDYDLAVAERLFLDQDPEYEPVDGALPNRNRTKGLHSPRRWLSFGLKNSMPANLNPSRGKRLADLGVHFITQVQQELEDQMEEDAAPGANLPPPTEDEVKSTLQLAILLGWGNRNRQRRDRIRVNNNLDDHEV